MTWRWLAAFAVAVLLNGVSPLAGQTPRPQADSVSRDSLAARLARAEAAIELLRQQLAVEAGTTVRTRSRIQVELSARILLNSFSSSGSLNNAEVPSYVVPGSGALPTPSEKALGLSLRQSRGGFAVSVDSVVGAHFDANVEMDLFGGVTTAATGAYAFPVPRLRTAYFTLRWARTELLAGAESPLISGLSPITLAMVGEPGFANAGNLWSWLPQLRLTRELAATTVGGKRLHWAVQAAVLHPASAITSANDEYAVTAGMRSGRPYLEGRLLFRWDDAGRGDQDETPADRSGEIGIGAHRGWLRLAGDTLSSSTAVSVDARIGLGHGLELRGEAYHGRGLAGLGGGAIDQSLGLPAAGASSGVPLRDTGGWLQVNWKTTPVFVTGVGCGIDNVDPADRPEREHNEMCAAHLLWRPGGSMVVGFEGRYLSTRYAVRTLRGTHLNFSLGFEL